MPLRDTGRRYHSPVVVRMQHLAEIEREFALGRGEFMCDQAGACRPALSWLRGEDGKRRRGRGKRLSRASRRGQQKMSRTGMIAIAASILLSAGAAHAADLPAM